MNSKQLKDKSYNNELIIENMKKFTCVPVSYTHLTQSRHIGILATAGTIKSESYPLEVHKLYPDIQVNGVACPMWVPLVENNEAQNEGTDYFIRKRCV